MAKEYIERDKAIEFIEQYTPHLEGETTLRCVKTALENVPTADVVEVVRCKDCKHGHRNGSGQLIGHYICEYDQNGCLKSSAHFCSYGERSENEHLLYG